MPFPDFCRPKKERGVSTAFVRNSYSLKCSNYSLLNFRACQQLPASTTNYKELHLTLYFLLVRLASN